MKLKPIYKGGMIVYIALSVLSPTTAQDAPGSEVQNMPSTSASDRDFQRVVEQQLQQREQVPAHAVDVAVTNGKVTLSGAVSNLAAKWHASEIAAEVRGVVDVQNRLEVSSEVKVPDEILAARVKAALSEEVATDLSELRVEVNNAIVTVRGETQSFQERIAIDEVVSRVAGVRGLRNFAAVSISSERRPDNELQADIVSRLAWNDSIDSNNIDVEVHDSVARLSGTVASASTKRKAVQCAWVTGVNRVDSSLLKVAPVREDTHQDLAARKSNAPARGGSAQAQRGSATEVNNHPAVADLVIQRLQSDHRLADDKLTVEINQRLATITGTVDTIYERDRVTQAASEVKGINRIYNLVRVRPEERIGDTALIGRVTQALGRDAYLEEFEITARADNGRIHLYGTVDSRFERNHAYDVVSRLPGVIAIDNNLLVRSDPREPRYSTPFYADEIYERSDEEILQDIEHQLFWSPFVDSDEVNVDVEKSGATLTGTVDSLAEKRAAEENAYERGATEVYNRLTIGDPGIF